MIINSTTEGFQLSKAEYDKSNLVFEVHNDKPQINVSLSHISFDFELKYNITSDPELISEVGNGIIKVRNLSVRGNGSPIKQYNDKKNKNEYLVEINEVALSCDNVTGHLQGGDISTILDNFSEIFFAFAQNFLMRTFDQAMRDSLTDIINHNIVKVNPKHEFEVKGHKMEFDYTLVD